MQLNQGPQVKCKECENTKEHHGKGLCFKCYQKQHIRKPVICSRCGNERPHKAFGLCTSCYVMSRRKK